MKMKKITLFFIGMVISGLGFSQTTVFEDNFDSYTVGEGIAYQSSDWWQWDNQNPPLGNAGDALISDVQSVSASNSMNIVNDKDIVYRFGNQTSGRFGVEFNMFIVDDATNGAYFNVEHVFGSNWAFSVFFDETGEVNLGDGLPVLTTYTKGTWFKVTLDFNINDNLTTMWFDTDSITSFAFNAGSGGTSNILDCINFYGNHGTGYQNENSDYFVDDFKFIEVVAETPANLVIDETPIVVNANQFTSETIHFENDGAIPLTYRAYAVYDYNATFTGSEEVDILTHTTNAPDANPQPFGIAPAGDPIGTQRKMTTRYYNEKLQDLIGMSIDSVLFVSEYVQGDSVQVSILERGSYIDHTALGAKIDSQSFYNIIPNAIQFVVLDEPYLLDGEEISVEFGMGVFHPDSALYAVEFTAVGEPVGATNGNYVNFNSGYAGSFYNNYIIVYCSGIRWPKWLNVDAANGTLNAGASDDITLTFTTADLTIGETYTAKVVFGCDAPNKEFSEVPVTITVITGLDEAGNGTEKIGVLSYPNPTTNYFNITSDAEITDLQVVSQSGQVVYSNSVNSKTVKIDMNTLPEGIYFAKVTVNNTVVTKKIVKE